MSIKRIAGLAAMCLGSAVAASILTIICLMLGIFGLTLKSPNTQVTSSTTTGLSPTPTIGVSPTPSVSPTPTPTASGASEQLTLQQNAQLVENIYQVISDSVVGVEIVVTESGTSISQTNEGSGLILSKTGDIATNAGILSIALDDNGRVLSNATILVKVKGIDQAFPATLTGRDIMTGLAVLKIDPLTYSLKLPKFAANNSIKVGQMVLAVGFPEILQEVGGLTSGLITGINRTTLLEDGTPVQMIQTNTPVSLACSGGPLVNLSGEVIGLTNCAIQQDSDASLSCVLPAVTVLDVTHDLIVNGEVTGRTWIGISVLDEAGFLSLKRLYGFPDGIYVSSVSHDGPAYTGNLRVGDIITEINDQKISTSMNLIKYLQGQTVGSLVEIKVYRRSDNKYHDLKVYTQEKTR